MEHLARCPSADGGVRGGGRSFGALPMERARTVGGRCASPQQGSLHARMRMRCEARQRGSRSPLSPLPVPAARPPTGTTLSSTTWLTHKPPCASRAGKPCRPGGGGATHRDEEHVGDRVLQPDRDEAHDGRPQREHLAGQAVGRGRLPHGDAHKAASAGHGGGGVRVGGGKHAPCRWTPAPVPYLSYSIGLRALPRPAHGPNTCGSEATRQTGFTLEASAPPSPPPPPTAHSHVAQHRADEGHLGRQAHLGRRHVRRQRVLQGGWPEGGGRVGQGGGGGGGAGAGAGAGGTSRPALPGRLGFGRGSRGPPPHPRTARHAPSPEDPEVSPWPARRWRPPPAP
jgi:hypothetical protein